MKAPPDVPRTLIDDLLAEQGRLTAVEQFARAHERHEVTTPRYRNLLPLSAPRPGEQYAFEVDLDKCSGCQACVTACHSLNGLDDGEAWREVGALHGEAIVPLCRSRREEAHSSRTSIDQSLLTSAATESLGNCVVPLQQIVTTACHHCIEPACLEGCPVLAYEKEPLTGIVRHLDDQCIGCSYCILKCPYDVPKYSEKRGIVRKCDMCHGRLAAGEAPACVQACPSEAIRITVANQAAVRAEFRSSRREKAHSSLPSIDQSLLTSATTNTWLPDSPTPEYTLPTTRYVTNKPAADLRATDHATPKPQPAHWPLILMLVLTQAGIGGMVATRFLEARSVSLELASLGLLFGGLAASVFHLGQPRKAWRVWLGWRTSWLSREAIALNAFAGAAVLAVTKPQIPYLTFILSGLALIAVAAQVMVYADTRRHSWRIGHTAPRFLGTTAVLGLALALAFQSSASLVLVLLAATLLKLACELALLKHADSDADRWTPLRRTAALQLGPLRGVLSLRLLAGLAGGVVAPFLIAGGSSSPALPFVALALCLLGEFAERHLFFTSVAPEKMPVG